MQQNKARELKATHTKHYDGNSQSRQALYIPLVCLELDDTCALGVVCVCVRALCECVCVCVGMGGFEG